MVLLPVLIVVNVCLVTAATEQTVCEVDPGRFGPVCPFDCTSCGPGSCTDKTTCTGYCGGDTTKSRCVLEDISRGKGSGCAQSTNMDTTTSASNAVNNRYASDLHTDCTHTDYNKDNEPPHINPQPWWRIDFGHDHIVYGLSLYNRISSKQERLSYFEVRVGDADIKTVVNTSGQLFTNNALCYYYNGTVPEVWTPQTPETKPYVEIMCDKPLKGRYLSVQNVDNFKGVDITREGDYRDIITICEVDIRGYKVCSDNTKSGKDCTVTDCWCEGGCSSSTHNIMGYCTNGCAKGRLGKYCMEEVSLDPITLSVDRDGNVDVKWTAWNTATLYNDSQREVTIQYQVQHRVSGSPSWTDVSSEPVIDGSSRSVKVTGLHQQRTHEICVRMMKKLDDDTTVEVTDKKCRTICAKPHFTVARPGCSGTGPTPAYIDVNVPNGGGDRCYIVSYKKNDEQTWNIVSYNDQDFSFRLTDLFLSTDYNVSIKVSTGLDSFLPRQHNESITTVSGVPGPVTNLRLTTNYVEDPQRPTATITVTWKAPQDRGCEGVPLNYMVFHAQTGENNIEKNITTTRHKVVIVGLSPNVTYQVWVIVENDRGMADGNISMPIRTAATSDPVPGGFNSLLLGVLAGLVVLIIVVVIIIAIILVVAKRRRLPRQTKSESVDGLVEMESKPGNSEVAVVNGSAATTELVTAKPQSTYTTTANVNNGKVEDATEETELRPYFSKHQPYAVPELESIVRTLTGPPQKFTQAYNDLPANKEYTRIAGARAENKPKNRYVDIVPFDHSRVRLKNMGKDSDYMHANWVEDYTGVISYIASQGPLYKKNSPPNTTPGFLNMIWTENVEVIVMVTDCLENGKEKCVQYWSDKVNGKVTIGGVTVTTRSIQTTSDKSGTFVDRLLQLKKGKETHDVRQFQYIGWPDHGVPPLCSSILKLREFVRKATPPGVLTLVHCSAGVGRTGTYIVIDDVLRQYEKNGEFSIEETAHRLRHFRGRMIQTDIQYVFVHHAILEYMKVGETVLSKSEFVKRYRKNGVRNIEYEILDLMRQLNMNEKSKGRLEVNAHKNRVPDIIPSDYDLPNPSEDSKKTDEYINACIVDNLSLSPTLIATQLPLEHTKVDFWNLIYVLNIKIIVRLEGDRAAKTPSDRYWPTKGMEEYGPYTVSLKKREDATPTYSVEVIKLQNKFDASSSDVRVFVYHEWPESSDLPTSVSSMLSLYQAVRQMQHDQGQQPVVIQCYDGAKRCGLYGAVYSLLESIKCYKTVDVYQATRITQITRRQFIPNMTQFRFLHDIACEFIDTCPDEPEYINTAEANKDDDQVYANLNTENIYLNV